MPGKTARVDEIGRVMSALKMSEWFGREVAENVEGEFRSDYSGRFMFGETCVGFVIGRGKEVVYFPGVQATC